MHVLRNVSFASQEFQEQQERREDLKQQIALAATKLLQDPEQTLSRAAAPTPARQLQRRSGEPTSLPLLSECPPPILLYNQLWLLRQQIALAATKLLQDPEQHSRKLQPLTQLVSSRDNVVSAILCTLWHPMLVSSRSDSCLTRIALSGRRVLRLVVRESPCCRLQGWPCCCSGRRVHKVLSRATRSSCPQRRSWPCQSFGC